ncbi:glycosyltransferase family A protein [Isachenkonia alkalipeptolytica]|uniref:Glycosyltransferase n=1 Tax=Isachenkonia alkalipeptolytica TaxID=2565777 RepID=A0AA44BGA7_9CLOT|nr:glycosyltransferase family A protein [Isachenkonia alkalipeptolytica]NBG89625.1 glycosyltransferase [Isachenkonia alkalipeptolytica]
MKLEVLISTMHQSDISLAENMNIKSDAIIINQCDKDDYYEKETDSGCIRMISVNDRGLSKSRNLAINNSDSDICVIADDDLKYHDGYKDIILKAYKKYPDADIIAFDVPSTNKERPTSSLKEGRVDFLHSMKIASFQITFKRKSIVDNNIRFNELFGAGSKYTCGEENILLTEAVKKGLKIYFVNEDSAIVDHNESTWFNGFDERLFRTKGAMFYEMNNKLAYLLILQFAIRKYYLYKNEMKFGEALRMMFEGMEEYKKETNK